MSASESFPAVSTDGAAPGTNPARRFQPWVARTLEVAVVLACIGVVFFRRLINLEDVEIGGDALTVWEFARNLVLGGEFPHKLNHHTTRFGLVIPTMMVQWLFGSHATAYYIGPLAASVLLHVGTYLIVRKLSGPLGGVVGVLWLLYFSPMERGSSQILPEAFGPMYATWATYAALLFTDAKSLAGRWIALSATGVGLIMAYGAKEVYLFYAPGVALVVWFGGAQGPLLPQTWLDAPKPDPTSPRWRRLLHAARTSGLVVPAALTAVVLLLVLIETVFLVGVADAGSRLDVVQSSHGGGGARGPRIESAGDFFALYTKAPPEWIQGLTAAFFAWLGVSAFARDRRSKLVGLTLLTFFLLQTFVVRRLDPLTPWFEPHPRYLLGMVGSIAMMIGIFVGDALRGVRGHGGAPSEKERIFSLWVALLLLLVVGRTLPGEFEAMWGKRGAWHKTGVMARDLTAAYDAGVPIFADTPGGKPAIAAAYLFIDPSILRDEKGNIIAAKRILRTTNRKGRFVARAALVPGIQKQRLRNAVEQRASERKCAVVLRHSVRFISGSTRFAKDCMSLEDEFAQDPRAGASSPHKARRKDKRSHGRSMRPRP